MTYYPKTMWNHICTLALGQEPSAYILTDACGRINEWYGSFKFLEPLKFNRGDVISDIFDFMHGILPLETENLVLPDLKIQSNSVIDIHIFQTDEGYGLIFLNVENKNNIRASLQQFTNAIEFENMNLFSKIVSGSDKTIHLNKENQSIKIVRIPVTIISADIKLISQKITTSNTKISDSLMACLQILSSAIFEHKGYIETLLGDCLVAIFGISSDTKNPASEALSAANLITKCCSESNSCLPCRIGIASGYVFIGYTRFKERRLFHCHGDCIQMATQLGKYNSEGQILIDELTYQAAAQHKKYFVPVQTDSNSDLSSSLVYQWKYKK